MSGDTPSWGLAHLGDTFDEALVASMVNGLDVEAALDLRDGPEFENAWNTAFDAINAEEGSLDAGTRKFIDSLRQHAYRLAYAATEHPEFAGAVSDDFGLVAAATALGFKDSFVAHLHAQYLDAQFPVDVRGPGA